MFDIDSSLIIDAMNFYKAIGYTPFKVPLIVDNESSGKTKPDGREDLRHLHGVYVASAEQSFIDLIIKGNIKKGKYCAITPCYRDEPVLDQTHLNIFLKIELVSIGIRHDIIYDAFSFMSKFSECKIINTEVGQDIEVNNIEVGSYGKHVINGIPICYGTGLAEPRFSYAVSKK